ncbi:hypothetical protein Vau01_120260 [Virgisporangium aurantiacum]|uniref:Uncharacterized protein n=1 Tax=Virgisporangium aurantiacum TaxID=175570 RepID=A0A8J4E6W3_9ACTN|nr:hypothetical protein Vau01_120260 [Virgisporangium aurantiacum]
MPDWQRRDPASVAPPLLVADWPAKPRSMLARTCTDPRDAVGWLRDEVCRWAARLLPPDTERMGRLLGYLDHRQAPDQRLVHVCGFGSCDVLCAISRHNRVVHWQHQLAGGHALVWAIVPSG